MSQRSEKGGSHGAGGAPQSMTAEQIEQLLRQFAAGELAAQVAPNGGPASRRDAGPKVEVALCDRGLKSVPTMDTWPEMRAEIKRAFEINDKTEARLRYCYTSPQSGSFIMIENNFDWQRAVENTRDAGKKFIAIQARAKRNATSPVKIKPDPEPNFIDLTRDEDPWRWPMSGSRTTGGRTCGSGEPKTARRRFQRSGTKGMSDLSTTEDDGDTSSLGYGTSRTSRGWDEALSDASDLASMTEHETGVKMPKFMEETEPETHVLNKTPLDPEEGPGETMPEARDEHRPGDTDDLDRTGDGEGEGRRGPQDPKGDGAEDDSGSASAESGAESADNTENSNNSAKNVKESNEGGEKRVENSDPAVNAQEKSVEEPDAGITDSTPAPSGSEDRIIEPRTDQSVGSDKRSGTSKYRRQRRYRCVAKDCQSRDDTVRGHMVPQGEVKRKEWLQAVGSPTAATRRPWVCRNHFRKEDYRAGASGARALLKREAVPRLSSWGEVPAKKAGLNKRELAVGPRARASESKGGAARRERALGLKAQIKCPECEDLIEEHRFQAHATTVHKYDQRTCPNDGCDFIFQDGDPTANIHHRVKHWVGRFPCSQCKGVYTTIFELDKHREAAYNAKVAETATCWLRGCNNSREVKQQNQLLRHVKDFQSSICRVCSIRVRGRHRMVAHMKKHGVALQPYHCKWCSGKFSTRTRTIEHLDEAHGLRYECQGCGVRFLHPKTLVRHERDSHREREDGGAKEPSVGGTGEPMNDEGAKSGDRVQDQGDGPSGGMELGEGGRPPTLRAPREEVCGCIAEDEEAAPGLAISKGTKISELSENLVRRRREVIGLLRGHPLTEGEERKNVRAVRLQPVVGYKPSSWTLEKGGDRPCIKRQGGEQPVVQAHEGDAAAIYIIPCASCAEGIWIGAIVVYGILEAMEEFAAQIGRMLPLLVKRLPDRITGNRRTRGTEECCNKKEATFLSNRLVNAGCVVESGHRRCAKARADPPCPELPGVKLASERTSDGRTQNKNIRELARCSRQLAYEVGLALKTLIPEVYKWHTTPTESSCRIDPEDKRGNDGADVRVGKCFSGCSILADVATHPHKDRGNRPGTASAMAILKSDTGAGAQHHFIQGYSIAGEKAGARAEIIMQLNAGDVLFEDSCQLYHGSTPAADGSGITRLGVTYYLSHHLEEKDHAAGTVERAAQKKVRRKDGKDVKRSSPRLAGGKSAATADPAAGSPGKGRKNQGAKRPKKEG